MDRRILEKAEELGQMLAASQEYEALQKARAVLEEHSAAKIMLNDIQQRQEKLRQKQAAGEQITEQDLQDLQRAMQVVSLNPYVRQVLEAEMAFAQMLHQVQRAINAPIGIELPEDMMDAAEETEDQAAAAKKAEEEAAKAARKRLWVPGR